MSRARFILIVAWVSLFASASAFSDQPVVTILGDFEDNTVAAEISDAQNTPVGDCQARFETNPARGQYSLAVVLGTSPGGSSATCRLQFQFASPFESAEKISTNAWINEGEASVGFRIRDAAGRLFDTGVEPVSARRRWIRIVKELRGAGLKPLDDNPAGPKAPLEFAGYRVASRSQSRQQVFLDDLAVEHRAPDNGLLRGKFSFDHPTHLYAPGSTVAAELTLENGSYSQALKQLSIELIWLRTDGSELTRTRHSMNLPSSSADFRSRQAVDIRQKIDETGLFRLVANVMSPGWRTPASFETTIAVTPSNRSISRGRSVFFGLQTNLLREPGPDRILEIDVAKDIGVQLLSIELPWKQVEAKAGMREFDEVDRVVDALVQRDLAAMLVITDPPEWLAGLPLEKQLESQGGLIEALARRYGRKLSLIQPLSGKGADAVTAIAKKRLEGLTSVAEVLALPLAMDSESAPKPATAETRVFDTYGDPAEAWQKIARFTSANRMQWGETHFWRHVSPPGTDAGYLCEAVALLRHYLLGARSGVRGVIWCDLRDDTSDPRFPEQMRGLLRRDYSPKTALLGYSNAVGMLAGEIYKGPLDGTPANFESAVFLANDRQVAVLIPMPNRAPPAAISPTSGSSGEITVQGFERRMQSPLDPAGALYKPLDRPLWIQFLPNQTTEVVQLSLAKPWLRVPADFLFDGDAPLTIEIDVLPSLGLKYVQLQMPPKSPLKSGFSAKDLKAESGKTVKLEIPLMAANAGEPLPTFSPVTLRVVGDRQPIEVPIRVFRVSHVHPLPASSLVAEAARKIGELKPVEADRPGSLALHAGYRTDALVVSVDVPETAPKGSEIQLGVALEEQERVIEIAIPADAGEPSIRWFSAWTRPDTGLRVARESAKSGPSRLVVEIPAAALGVEKLGPGQLLRMAARYEPPIGARTGLGPLRWGDGLTGGANTGSFERLRLVGAK